MIIIIRIIQMSHTRLVVAVTVVACIICFLYVCFRARTILRRRSNEAFKSKKVSLAFPKPRDTLDVRNDNNNDDSLSRYRRYYHRCGNNIIILIIIIQ